MNLRENIRKELKQESLRQTLMDYIMRWGIRDTANSMSVDVKELLEMVGMKGTQEDMIFLTKAIMEKEVEKELNYCSYNIVPSLHSIKLYVYTPKPLPENKGTWYHDKWLRQEAEGLIRHLIYELGGGLIRGHIVNVSNKGDC